MCASFRPSDKPGQAPGSRRSGSGGGPAGGGGGGFGGGGQGSGRPATHGSRYERRPAPALDREGVAASLRRYLDAIVPAMHFDVYFKIEIPRSAGSAAAFGESAGNTVAPAEAEFESPDIIVDFAGPDGELLLERGAELLKALEHVALRSVRLDPQLHDRVRFDCANYRADRIAELKLSAQVAAQRVRETRVAFRFNPMPARERRIIHLVLKDQADVRTVSEGVGEERQLVIYAAGSK
jgi:spoIIIJ-associated protein